MKRIGVVKLFSLFLILGELSPLNANENFTVVKNVRLQTDLYGIEVGSATRNLIVYGVNRADASTPYISKINQETLAQVGLRSLYPEDGAIRDIYVDRQAEELFVVRDKYLEGWYNLSRFHLDNLALLNASRNIQSSDLWHNLRIAGHYASSIYGKIDSFPSSDPNLLFFDKKTFAQTNTEYLPGSIYPSPSGNQLLQTIGNVGVYRSLPALDMLWSLSLPNPRHVIGSVIFAPNHPYSIWFYDGENSQETVLKVDQQGNILKSGVIQQSGLYQILIGIDITGRYFYTLGMSHDGSLSNPTVFKYSTESMLLLGSLGVKQYLDDSSLTRHIVTATLDKDSGNIFVMSSNYFNSDIVKIDVRTAPYVAEHPQSVKMKMGDTIVLSCRALGTGIVTYQWRRNGINLNAQISDHLTVKAESSTSFGEYDCVVSNDVGSSVSNKAIISESLPPVLLQVESSTGSMVGGEIVVIKGQNLMPDGVVLFGGSRANSAQDGWLNSTQIKVYTPAHAAGVVDLVFTNPDGQSSTLKNAFRYIDPPPSAPTNLRASRVESYIIDLAWNAATDNVSVAKYKVYRNNVFVKETTALSVVESGLSANTQYSYKVTALDAAGNESVASNVITPTTLPVPDTQAPAAPSNLRTTAITQTQIDLAWNAATDNVGVTKYKIYRNNTFLKESTTLTAIDSGLSANTSYSYKVTAVDAAGNESVASNEVTVTTLPTFPGPDMTPPTTPGNLRVKNITPYSITVEWDPSTDNVAIREYAVYKQDYSLPWKFSRTTEAVLENLSPETVYDLKVMAMDLAGNMSEFSNIVSAKTSAVPSYMFPSIPQNLRVTEVTRRTITLAWDPSTDDVGILRYEIQGLEGNYSVLGVDQSIFVMGLNENTSYRYSVRAVDSHENKSAYSNFVTTKTLESVLPSAPSSLRTTSITQTQIDLAWNAATDNVEVVKYKVYRNNTFLKESTTLTAVDSGLTPNTQYNYKVTAVDGSGNESVASNTLDARTLVTPDTQAPSVPGNLHTTSITQTQVDLAWNASIDNLGVVKYKVYRNNLFLKEATTLTANDSGLSPNTSYSYKVKALDAAGNESLASDVLTVTTLEAPDTTPPSVPTNVRTPDVQVNQVILIWDASLDGESAIRYRIVRDGFVIGETDVRSFVDSHVAPNSEYRYKVRAVNAADLSSDSEEIAVKTPGVGSGVELEDDNSGSGEFKPFVAVVNPNAGPMLIEYDSLPGQSVEIKIYDRSGRLVRELSDINSYTEWDGRNSDGEMVASDTYLVYLKIGGKVSKRTVAIVK